MNMTKMPQFCPFKHSLLYHEANKSGGEGGGAGFQQAM